MTKFEKLRKQVNDEFRDDLKKAMARKGVDVVSEYNFFIDRLVTRTIDGKNMSPKQMEYLRGFSDGYEGAMQKIPFR